MVDRVQPLKLEAPNTGGVEVDEFPTAVDVHEDFLECAGIAVQDADNRDEKTLIWRSGNDMKFKDGNNPSGYTLTQLAAYLIDLYLECEPPVPSTDYSNTYSSNRVDQEQWKRHLDSSLLKQIDYTYTGSRVTKEIRKIFDTDGSTVIGQLTIDYNYTGHQLTGEVITRDV